MCRLSSGDLSFIGNGPDGPLMVGIELKSVSDLISSLQSGRLQDTQLGGMLNDYQEIWLLIYGRYRPSPKDGITLQVYREGNAKRHSGWYDYTFSGSQPMKYGYVEAALSSPSLSRSGILVKRVETIEEAAAWCGVIYRSWTKKWHEHKLLRTIDRSSSSLVPASNGMDDRMRQRLDFAMAFRGCGLGYERSLAVAKHFGSPIEMFTASEEEWANISVKSESGRVFKLGPVLAKSVKGAIR